MAGTRCVLAGRVRLMARCTHLMAGRVNLMARCTHLMAGRVRLKAADLNPADHSYCLFNPVLLADQKTDIRNELVSKHQVF